MARRLLSPGTMREKQSRYDARDRRRRSGVTALEMMVTVAVVGVLAVAAIPSFEEWQENLHLKDAARKTADALIRARSEAIRTGNAHIVFLAASQAPNPPATDPFGLALPSPIFVIDDGPLGTNNCGIDPTEGVFGLPASRDTGWGSTPTLSNGLLAPNDTAGDPTDGTSFQTPLGAAATWVLFRPDGIPVSFDGAGCNLGGPGTGAGGIYLTNGLSDYAVVLSPLGGVRVHAWGPGGWTN